MKKRITLTCLSMALACSSLNASEFQEKSTASPTSEEETLFAPGKGVKVSMRGAQAIGLATAPVEAQAQKSTRNYTLQIFRQADEQTTGGKTEASKTAYASALIPAEEARELTLNQAVTLTNPNIAAQLAEIDWQLEPITAQAEIIVSIADPEAELIIGTFLSAALELSSNHQSDRVRIPSSAVLSTAKGEFAYAVNGNYFFRTPIVVVERSGDYATISEGLYEGDVVASYGVEQLHLIELQTTNGGKGCAHGH